MNVTNVRPLFAGIGLLVALALPAAASAQQGTVAGRVTDQASGQPIVGARVGVVGTTLVTQTNAEGRYSLGRIPVGVVMLRVSAIGYGAGTSSVTIAAGEIVAHDVVLKLQPFSLDEVVVTATGEQAKREVGNAVSTVAVDSVVATGPIANMNDLLGARTPGVEVLPSAITGGGARVRIRGTNSLSLSNEPIYYIDGIRMESSVNSSSIGIGGTNPSRVNDINADEIESYDVVKGPSASTLYGTDAANGVIVITTKRGRAGKASWDTYLQHGWISDHNTYPTAYTLFGHSPTGALRTTALGNCSLPNVSLGTCILDSVAALNLFAEKDLTPLAPAYQEEYGAGVSGGSETLRYFLQGNYAGEQGVYRVPDFEIQRLLARNGSIPGEQLRPNALTR